jgi:copper chaperone NosL
MLIVDKRFGAEIVTAKGKIFKFDSIECMHHFEVTENEKLGSHFAEYLANTEKQGELMLAEDAYICEDPTVHSPMGKGYLTADSKEKIKIVFAKNDKACPVFRWNELTNKLGK